MASDRALGAATGAITSAKASYACGGIEQAAGASGSGGWGRLNNRSLRRPRLFDEMKDRRRLRPCGGRNAAKPRL